MCSMYTIQYRIEIIDCQILNVHTHIYIYIHTHSTKRTKIFSFGGFSLKAQSSGRCYEGSCHKLKDGKAEDTLWDCGTSSCKGVGHQSPCQYSGTTKLVLPLQKIHQPNKFVYIRFIFAIFAGKQKGTAPPHALPKKHPVRQAGNSTGQRCRQTYKRCHIADLRIRKSKITSDTTFHSWRSETTWIKLPMCQSVWTLRYPWDPATTLSSGLTSDSNSFVTQVSREIQLLLVKWLWICGTAIPKMVRSNCPK